MDGEFVRQQAIGLVPDIDPFLTWAMHYPLRAVQVKHALDTLEQWYGTQNMEAFIAMRDAARTVQSAALAGGFPCTAAFFGGLCEECCKALIPYSWQV